MTGKYRTFDLVIEPSIRKVDHKKVEFWRISTELNETVKEKFYLQSESQEGRLTKVVDLELVTTGDTDFDKNILLFSSNSSLAKKMFNSYLRGRLLWAGFKDFTMEINENSAVLEIYTEQPTNVRFIRHSIEVWTELLNIILMLS